MEAKLAGKVRMLRLNRRNSRLVAVHHPSVIIGRQSFLRLTYSQLHRDTKSYFWVSFSAQSQIHRLLLGLCSVLRSIWR